MYCYCHTPVFLLQFAALRKLLLSSNSCNCYFLRVCALHFNTDASFLTHGVDYSHWVEFYLSFPSSLTQDSVQQRWCGGQGDREGSPGGGLWDMWQGFRRADCSALCRTYHCHQDLPEHHRAHHQLPQQDQTGREERHWTKLIWRAVKTITRTHTYIVSHGFQSSDFKLSN